MLTQPKFPVGTICIFQNLDSQNDKCNQKECKIVEYSPEFEEFPYVIEFDLSKYYISMCARESELKRPLMGDLK